MAKLLRISLCNNRKLKKCDHAMRKGTIRGGLIFGLVLGELNPVCEDAEQNLKFAHFRFVTFAF